MNLTRRIFLLLLITVSLNALSNIFLTNYQGEYLYRDSEKILAHTIVQSLRDALVQDVIDGNKLRVTNLLQSITAHNNPIEFLYVTDIEHTVFAHSFEQGFPRYLLHKQIVQWQNTSTQLTYKYQTEQGLIFVYREALIPGLETVLHIGINQSHITGVLEKNTQYIMEISSATALIVLLIAYFWGRKITAPLADLAHQIQRFGSGKEMNFTNLEKADPDIRHLALAFQSATEERRLALTELQEREQDLAITLNSIGDAVIATDAQGNVTRMNPVAEQLTHWSLKDAMGLPLKDIFPIFNATSREPIENPIEKVMGSGETVYLSNHTTLLAKDGTEYQISDSAAPIRNKEDGSILGMVLVFNDVTEQYQLREAAAKSKRDLQSIMDHSPAVIYMKDTEGRYTFINQQFKKMFHPPQKHLIGKTDHDIFPENIANDFHRNDQAVLEARHALEFEEAALHDDGLHTYFSIKFPLFDDTDNIYAICGISTDITQRKKMEDEIYSSEQHLKLYREQAPLASIEWNPDFQIVDWNRAAEKMFGYTLDEVKGKDFVTIMLPESAIVDVKKIWSDLMRQTGGTKSINENITKDGRIILCEWHNTPLKDESGNVIGASSIVQDITQRKLQEEQLRRSQKMDALGKLTGGIAHDYNNLLGIIQGYAEQLNEHLDHDSRLVKFAQNIQRAAERGTTLTQKLLAFSRQKAPDAMVLNINALLQEQQLILEKTLTAVIELIFDLADELWLVKLDSGDLEDAIVNLSINARHAMESGGQLTFRTRNEQLNETDARQLHLKAGDYVSLSITDTGHGMDEAAKERIFDPFFTTKGERGTGLGLSQVYGFVDRSGGTIKVYSEPGHGSRFTLYFPRSNQTVIETQTPVVTTTRNLQGSETILVVDDEQDMVTLAYDILTARGYRILTANNGKQALAVLEKESVNLIISDIIMPIMDGYQLAVQVQQHYPYTQIQLTSGFADDRHKEMVDETLHQNILNKPYTSHALLSRVRSLLDKAIKKDNLSGRTILVMDDDEDIQELFKLNLEKLGCKTIPTFNGEEAIDIYRKSLNSSDRIDIMIVDISIPGGTGGKEVADKIRVLDPHAKIVISSGHTESPEMTHFQDYGFQGALEKDFSREKIKHVLEKVLSST